MSSIFTLVERASWVVFCATSVHLPVWQITKTQNWQATVYSKKLLRVLLDVTEGYNSWYQNTAAHVRDRAQGTILLRATLPADAPPFSSFMVALGK